MPAGTRTGARGASLEVDTRPAGDPRRLPAAVSTKPGPSRAFGMRESLRSEPSWNAGRRARFAKREPRRKARWMVISVFRRFAFLYFLRRWLLHPDRGAASLHSLASSDDDRERRRSVPSRLQYAPDAHRIAGTGEHFRTVAGLGVCRLASSQPTPCRPRARLIWDRQIRRMTDGNRVRGSVRRCATFSAGDASSALSDHRPTPSCSLISR